MQSRIPAFYWGLFGSEADWNFKSEAQVNLCGRIDDIHQGKALGGSSATNAQMWAPPTPGVIDSWSSLGNPGWNWASLRPYYNRVFRSELPGSPLRENLGIDAWTSNNENSGPVQTYFPDPSSCIRRAWLEAFESIGFRMHDDPWLDGSVGAFPNLSSVDLELGQRSDASRAYYQPHKGRENLHVITQAVVEKVNFLEGTTEACGVQYHMADDPQKRIVVDARKEVIIAAGALQSPKILELSGIGNPDILEHHSIPVVANVPGVGENLQDHLVCDVTFEASSSDSVRTSDSLARQEPETMKEAMDQFVTDHAGVLTHSGILVYAFMPVFTLQSPEGRERLEKLFDQNKPPARKEPAMAREQAYYEVARQASLDIHQPSGAHLAVLGQNPTRSDPITGQRSMDVLPGKHITLAAIPSQPLSRGTVHIKSTNVSDHPVIDPKFLSHPIDLEIYAEHMMFLKPSCHRSRLSMICLSSH
ncbi:GMC oxidoreductase-domain-containing protein [Xylariomycetidae sp. FL2044]|nr:GMC oxidoreductase-domain-containing protein [Xylariomycetidae sp. FL2044]